MSKMKLFSPARLGNIELKNHIAMAPMTRNRASAENIPGQMIARYYEQRASAGLIITEGTSPSPNGVGYARIPGIYNKEQVEGWKLTTHAVHKKGGKIFLQMMHTGRVGNSLNLPEGAEVIAPSAIAPAGKVVTDEAGMQDYTTPREMTQEDIRNTIQEYIQASVNAIEAGFDGVELHSANGYLLEQFLSPHSNQRTDEFGGNYVKRANFVLTVVRDVIKAIGKERTAIRLSPYGVNADMHPYPEIEETYLYLAEKLNELGIVYLHLVDHSSMGAPEVPLSLKKKIRDLFKGTLMLSGGYDKARAEEDLQSGFAGLVAFGKPFISNPDFVERLEKDAPLAAFDFSTFYTPGEKGYVDYPVLGD
jgi:N-ethylmaleimide reductase